MTSLYRTRRRSPLRRFLRRHATLNLFAHHALTIAAIRREVTLKAEHVLQAAEECRG